MDNIGKFVEATIDPTGPVADIAKAGLGMFAAEPGYTVAEPAPAAKLQANIS